MTAAPVGRPDTADPLGLLGAALTLARTQLQRIRPADLALPSTCDGWSLGALLRHMDESLDVFTEAAGGQVQLVAAPMPMPTVDSLCVKACSLRDVWAGHDTSEDGVITIGDHRLPSALLIRTAAIEIAVHGWDVGRTLSGTVTFPDELAEALLPTALDVVAVERAGQFGPPRPVRRWDPPGVRLLAHLGRG